MEWRCSDGGVKVGGGSRVVVVVGCVGFGGGPRDGFELSVGQLFASRELMEFLFCGRIGRRVGPLYGSMCLCILWRKIGGVE